MKKTFILFFLFLLLIICLLGCGGGIDPDPGHTPSRPPEGIFKYLPDEDNWQWKYQLQRSDGSFFIDANNRILEANEILQISTDTTDLKTYTWNRKTITYEFTEPLESDYVEDYYPQGVLKSVNEDLAILIKDNFPIVEIINCYYISEKDPNNTIDFTCEEW